MILAPPKPIDSGGNTITPDKAGTLRLTAQDFLIELTNCNLRAEGIGVLETAVVDGDVEPYLDTSTLFRTGANGSCGGQRLPTLDASICSRANEPTSADSTVTTDVALAGVTWGVLNRLDAPLAKSFRIQLKKGATVHATETVNGLAAKAQKTFVYRRPENRRRALKVRNCPACLDTLFYNWIEPTYTVEVDADKTLKEGNAGEANNRKDYLP